MFYHFFDMLTPEISMFNVFRYITFRTICASLTALTICFVLGPPVIRLLAEKQVGQYIRSAGPESHKGKAGTPTMGGVLILLAVFVSTLLWVDLTNLYIWIVLFVGGGYFAIGFVDDYLKQIQKRNLGLTARMKFALQIAIAAVAGIMIYAYPGFNTQVTVPFFKTFTPDLGAGYILFAVLVIVGASNAVNLTDGLDGLAIGPVVIASATYMLFAYVTGHIKIAQYLQINYLAGCGELTIVCGAMAGAGLGFLWYNTHPAEIFMEMWGLCRWGRFWGSWR